MAQHDYTSQFSGAQANAKLVIHSHDGTEYEYTPFGTDVSVPADSYVIDTTITFAEFRDDVQSLGVPVVLLVNTAQGQRVYVFCGSDATYFYFVCIQGGSLYWQKLSSNGWTNGSYFLDLIESANAPITIVGKSITNNGTGLTVTGLHAWAEGDTTKATAECAHAEGWRSEATGTYSHAEGWQTMATGTRSHAEGAMSEATGHTSHAEGDQTSASGYYSHAGGAGAKAKGRASFAHGRSVEIEADDGVAFGLFNSDKTAKFVIGDGTEHNNRHDAFKVDANGDTWIMINGVLTNISSMLA